MANEKKDEDIDSSSLDFGIVEKWNWDRLSCRDTVFFLQLYIYQSDDDDESKEKKIPLLSSCLDQAIDYIQVKLQWTQTLLKDEIVLEAGKMPPSFILWKDWDKSFEKDFSLQTNFLKIFMNARYLNICNLICGEIPCHGKYRGQISILVIPLYYRLQSRFLEGEFISYLWKRFGSSFSATSWANVFKVAKLRNMVYLVFSLKERKFYFI